MVSQYLDYLTDPNFQAVNRLFILSFENVNDRIGYKEYFLPTIEIKNYNVMIDGQNDQPAQNNLRTYDIIQKIAAGQGDDYITDCLLSYNYFNEFY